MSLPIRTAILYVHGELSGPGRLGPALEEAGFRVVERFRDVSPEDVEASLVVALGGSMAAYDVETHAFLRSEMEVLQRRLARDRPVLGVCLGAQLLAAAAGARVFPGAQGTELGVFPVQLTPEGRTDPVFGPLDPGLDVPHWHSDTFDDVPGAVRLAFSERYAQQAFRLGSSYGIQFHPEVDEAMVRHLLGAYPDAFAQAGRDPDEMARVDVERLRQVWAAQRAFLDRLARHFADLA